MCVYECLSSLVCMVVVIFVYADAVFGFYGYSFLCLVGCFSMITWTPAVLSVLYACVLYFCMSTCLTAQLSMFHMERRSRNTLIIIIIMMMMIIIILSLLLSLSSSTWRLALPYCL